MEIALQPVVLKWARERAGLSLSLLAQRLGTKVERISDWERTGRLKFKDAEKLAQKTYTPFGCLYLENPPEDTLPISDFRTLDNAEVIQASPDLLETIDLAVMRQDWFREYQISMGESELAFVGSLQEGQSVQAASEKIRQVIPWDTGLRSGFSKWEDALKAQVEVIEEVGILVMKNGIVGSNTHRKLDVNEFRGFALSDKYAPLIFLNAADAMAAQMFTLAHEIVHIFIGISGVSNLAETYANGRPTEQFCNKVAAELLVPEAELRAVGASGTSPQTIQSLCRYFKVSSLVILRRLKDIGILDDPQFRAAYEKEEDRFRALSKRKSGGGDYYKTQGTRIGGRFSSALIESTLEGRTPYREALQLFGTKNVETFKEYARGLNFIP